MDLRVANFCISYSHLITSIKLDFMHEIYKFNILPCIYDDLKLCFTRFKIENDPCHLNLKKVKCK
jgi:hypothetical protein